MFSFSSFIVQPLLRCTLRIDCKKISSLRIYEYIKATGPMTVAQYMKECLSNPLSGYYMKQTVFGKEGDFVTSPELSQVFGELIGVWVMADWMIQDKPSPVNIVELGPGRGSMMVDILRALKQLKLMLPVVNIHLVETSPLMKRRQISLLTGTPFEDVPETISDEIQSTDGVNVSWYTSLSQVPHGFGYYLAHEFIDALPIHQFTTVSNTTTGGGDWREVLVDIDRSSTENKLCFVKAPGPTPSSLSYSSLLVGGANEGEVCPNGLAIVEEISQRVKKYGGGALIADYGEEKITKFTFRGYSNHKEVNVLSNPGENDLTADVNFGHLKQVIIAQGCTAHGTITQNEFLHKMGIRHRFNMLLHQASDPAVIDSIVKSYEFLTSSDKMGERFKFLSITNTHSHTPTPF